MAKECITTDQLKYFRLISDRDERLRGRWLECFSWYPERQHQDFNHVSQIYDESRQHYGEEQYLKYAQVKRLNQKYRPGKESDKGVLAAQGAKEQQEQGQHRDSFNINSLSKMPPTTNAEYGRFKPTSIHYC